MSHYRGTLIALTHALCRLSVVYLRQRGAATRDAEWEESEHPREENGRFGRAGAGSAPTPKEDRREWGAAANAPGPRAMHPASEAERKALRVPPAWADVRVADDPDSPLQVVGRDSKGRAQYRYSAAHTSAASESKFERAVQFDRELERFGPRIMRAAYTPGPNQEEAAVLRLIHLTGFRVGSNTDTRAKVRAYGASTLRAEHVSIDGPLVTFDFTGKKGVRIQKTMDDPEMAALLAPRVRRGGALFDTDDGRIRAYLRKVAGPFKVHDFRAWHGTKEAEKAMKGMPVPRTAKEFAAARHAVGKIVAAHLGNTPDMALKAYIDPRAFREWEAAVGKGTR